MLHLREGPRRRGKKKKERGNKKWCMLVCVLIWWCRGGSWASAPCTRRRRRPMRNTTDTNCWDRQTDRQTDPLMPRPSIKREIWAQSESLCLSASTVPYRTRLTHYISFLPSYHFSSYSSLLLFIYLYKQANSSNKLSFFILTFFRSDVKLLGCCCWWGVRESEQEARWWPIPV